MKFVDKHKNDDIKFQEICQDTIKNIRANFMFVNTHNKNYQSKFDEICRQT